MNKEKPQGLIQAQRELHGLLLGSEAERTAYWKRYEDLALEVVNYGLTLRRLEELGGSLREGFSLRDVQVFISDSFKNSPPLSAETLYDSVRINLQRGISFS